MTQTLLRKSMATILLVLFLTFSIFSTCTLIAQAEKSDPTIGKFLTIDFSGSSPGIANSGCYVIATKVSSETEFKFYPDTELVSIRVGAGTVFLEAISGNGWTFLEWSEDVESQDGNTGYYKTQKEDTIHATFVRTYIITATVFGQVGSGRIETTVENGDYVIPAGSSAEIPVMAGEEPVFTFIENLGEISLLCIDGVFKEPTGYTYSFPTPVYEDHSLVAYFSLDGQAIIPFGADDVPISLGDDVKLTFETLAEGGTAIQNNLLAQYPNLQFSSLILWDVGTNFGIVDTVTIALPLPEGVDEIDSVIMAPNTVDGLNALYSDVSEDGEVTHADVNEVAIAISTMANPNGRGYDPKYDVNRDGSLDQADIAMVQYYVGTDYLQIPIDFWVEENTLFIVTDHFSIFRGR